MAYLLSNPIAFAHFQLRGGWKRGMAVAAGYMVVLGGLILAFVQMNPRTRSRDLGGWTYAVLSLQVGTCVLFCASRVSAAIRADITNRMLESHRLMPTNAAEGVVGYILGPVAGPLMLIVANLLIGVFTCNGSGMPLDRWFFANGILLTFSMMTWVVAALAGFLARGAAVVIFLILGITLMSQGMMTAVMPGLAVIISPVIRRSIYSMESGPSDLSLAYVTCLAAQAIFAGVCFSAACRKYRRPDAPAFTPALGLMLLTIWVAVTVAGISAWSEFEPKVWHFFVQGLPEQAQFLFSMAATMLLAIVPISSAAQQHTMWLKRRKLDPHAKPPFWHPLAAAGFALGVMLIMLTLRPPPTFGMHFAESAGRTVAALLAFTFSISLFLQLAYRRLEKPLLLGAAFLLVTVLAPLLVDVVRHATLDEPEEPLMTRIATLSPLGTMINLWSGGNADTTRGLAAQFILLLLLMLARYHTRRPAAGLMDSPMPITETPDPIPPTAPSALDAPG